MKTKIIGTWQLRAARGTALLLVLLCITSIYLWICRPYQLHWGATEAEIERSMAGDELNLSPSFLATRAITIEGNPEEIWPWLVQMGYGRAGYYGYDLLENAGSPEGVTSADEILPRFQAFVVGDEVPISAVVSMTFHEIEPNRHIIWLGDEVRDPGVFTWTLYPLDASRTRLVSRIRWTYHPTSIGIFALELFTEFADHIAVRKILQGVKQRVERDIEPMWIQNVELLTFICTLLTFLTALALLCWRPFTWKTWGAGLIAGVIWLATWYAPVANWISVVLALCAIGTLFFAHRGRPRISEGRTGISKTSVRPLFHPTSISAGLCAVGLCLATAAKSSTGIDICRDPSGESHLAIAYYGQEESPFEQAPGATNRDDFRTDLLFASGEQWSFGFGHRSAILNVDNLELQTNGYLHSFFFPLHWTRQAEGSSFRFSVAPVLSGSSNVIKDPGEYSRDAFQLLAAMVWSRSVSDRLDLSYGICGDHRLGGYQVYPVVSLEWRPHPDWSVELGFPASQLSYRITQRLDSSLRISPNGNEWFVKDKALTKSSAAIYEAYLVEWALNWRLHERFMMTASVGNEFDAQYEVTLIDDSRVRLSSESAVRIGVALAWFF